MAEVVVALQLSERLQEQFNNSTQPAGLFGFVWKLPSYFSSPTMENSGHDDKSSSRKGKINIIRSSVANDGDLSDLHTESSGASKINSHSSSVPTTEDGGNYKGENASAKVTKAMQTFTEEHRSATELMSLKNALLHLKKTVANKRTSDIVLSDNLDAATTKDELLKAQEREQKLLEQDKKVEQTKHQRNTLEYFIYDTRSKLQNAYKRFVTELENDEITKRLQETEDWLYEDSDDECDEQIYSGRLEDLKKLLEPIENRYKDENKEQATKPLLAMIEENRLVANSLPLKNKKQLINACMDVEQYLSRHSPENYDPIGWSNFIKETMGTFKRMCEKAIQPKPNEEKVQAAKPLLSMIEEYRFVANSLPHENQMKLINACKEVEQHLSGHPPEHYDPIGWSNFIRETMGIFKSRCEEAMQYKPYLPEHPEPVESDRNCNHVNSQTRNPMDVKKKGKSMDGNRTGNSMDGKQTGKSMDGKQTGKSMDGNRTGKPVKLDKTSKPVDGDQTGKPVDGDQTGKPVDGDQTGKPVKPDQSSKPVDGNQTCKPVDGDHASKPVQPDQASKPIQTDQASKPVQTDQTSKPVNMGQTDEPFDSEQMHIPDLMQVDEECISL